MLLAQVLPLAMFLLAAEMVIGCFAVMLLTDLEGEIGGAFLGRYALTFFAGGLFTAWLRGQYPAPATLQEMGVRTEWLPGEGRAFTFFLIFLGLYNPATWFGLRLLRKGLGILAVVAGVTTLVFSALAYGQAPWYGLGTVLNFLAASLVLGGATTGLAVGHSYLSTPLLSPRPLRHITIVLFCALLIQILSLPVYLGLVGFPAAAERGRELLGTYGLILGVRVAIGLLFPLVLAVLAWHTTRMKAMRSATGLLYIGSGVVLTGEIVAKVLFFIGGLPV
jgi:DMSO reductase anchor subunit